MLKRLRCAVVLGTMKFSFASFPALESLVIDCASRALGAKAQLVFSKEQEEAPGCYQTERNADPETYC